MEIAILIQAGGYKYVKRFKYYLVTEQMTDYEKKKKKRNYKHIKAIK